MSLGTTIDTTVRGDVEVAFAVINEDTDPIELRFRSGQTADLAVYEDDTDGDPVWRWSDGRMFTMAVDTARLDPGERLVQEFVWTDPPAGEYVAVATLEADASATATTTFTVE